MDFTPADPNTGDDADPAGDDVTVARQHGQWYLLPTGWVWRILD